jgi:hypothetical protein
MLLGGCLALVLTAAPAAAELSSVDAYGGQAQVLGAPVRHQRAPGASTGARGSGRGSAQSTPASGSEPGGESTGSSSSPGSHPTAGSGAPIASGSNGARGVGGDNGAGESHGRGAGAAGTGGASGASGAGQSPPIAAANVADVSDGSLSLSALDVLLLAAVCVGLAGVGVLIRRSSRQSE